MKYGIIGAGGRMGKEIAAVFAEAGHDSVFEYDVTGEVKTSAPEVLIDFSLPAAFSHTIKYARALHTPLVMGTTGLSPEQFEELHTLSKELPVVQSYNYSVGVQMLLRCIETVAGQLKNWDTEIVETHHRFKKDKPSGTALMMKEKLGKDAPISSLRVGNIPGIHTITFGSLGETLSIEHSATSRRTFAEGVLLSAEFLPGKNPGLYSFKDVLDSRI